MVVAACGGGGTGPGDHGVPLSTLLVLPRLDLDSEPGSPVTLTYKNNLLNNFTISHTDNAGTRFASLTFPSHSIVSVNNVVLADTSTVFIGVTLISGQYMFTLAPPAMVFNISGEPTVTIVYSKYGDLSVYGQSPKYASAAAYEAALGLWREVSADRWVPGRNTGHLGVDTVASALEAPGRYVIAAPR